MDQLPEYVVANSENLVCRLSKFLYGLKCSRRVQFDRFSFVVFGYSFQCFTFDYIVLVYHNFPPAPVLILDVDNIIIFESDRICIAKLKRYLGQQLHTKYLGAFTISLEI